jgi:MioC protein
MGLRIRILVGTVTGNAEMVADEMKHVIGKHGGEAEIVSMDGLRPGDLQPGPLYVICTSTHGVGDIPDNALDFFEDLRADAPDLSWMRYGVFGLGDSVYSSTFCFGGRRFDELLRSLGATRIGELGIHDASEDGIAEETGHAWVERWMGLAAG